MKLVFKIAKTELRSLFYSPIAWFLTIAFLVQCAILYTNMLNSKAIIQEMGGIGLQYMTRLTYNIFASPFGGIFISMMQNLYLYIPLITMGLISREINGGTISLLYSSPVKIREIVFGKYLAMMIYSLVLVAVVGIFMLSGIFNIESADVGLLCSATLGFYLLLCAYSAIGLFMSSLTSYQVVAAVGTFITIGILSYVGRLWQGIDFVRDLTYFLSLNGRTQHMLSGLITTKDILYFIIIVYMFLGFTIYKLKGGRESKPLSVKIIRYVAIIASALFIGYISSRPALTGYWDTTANKENTLTSNTQKIIHALGASNLEVTAYSNLLDDHYYLGMPERRNRYLSNWEPYMRFKPDIKFRFINYYDSAMGNRYNMYKYYQGKTIQQIAEQRAKALGAGLSVFKTPDQIHKMTDLRSELNRFVMQLKYKDRTTFLRIFDDRMVWPSETEVSAAFKRLLQARMPKIAFVTGNGERNINKTGDREYKTLTTDKTFRYALINQGFDVDTLSLDIQDIPDSITALVIADPVTVFSVKAIHKIQQYIAGGGNLLIAGEPGRQHILNSLLKGLGVQMMKGMLEQHSDDNAPTMVLSRMTAEAIGFSKSLDEPSVDTVPVSMNGVAGISYADTMGFDIVPLLQTVAGKVKNTMARNPDLDLVSKENNNISGHTTPPINAVPAAASGQGRSSSIVKKRRRTISSRAPVNAHENQVYPTAIALMRKINGKEQRIIISGDADFMGNRELSRRNPQVSNFYFSTALFSWLDYGQFPIDTSRPDAKDNRLNITTDGVALLKIFFVWILPGLLLAFGAILLIRRKRK